jgi:hypothetical protein
MHQGIVKLIGRVPEPCGKFHTPSDFVVDQEASDAESGLYREILLLDDVWTTFC